MTQPSSSGARGWEFRGDSPVDYWSEEEPEEPEPFGLAEVNRKLAALGRETA